MKITKEQLSGLIKEEFNRIQKRETLNEELRMINLEHDLLEEGLKDWLVGAVIVLASTLGKGQTIEDKIKELPYDASKKMEVSAALRDPAVKEILKKYDVLDNNVQKQLDRYQEKGLGSKDVVKFGTPVKTSDEMMAKYYLETGWHLTAVEVKEKIKESEKKDIPLEVIVKSLNFKSDKLFGAGKFELSSVPEVKKMLDSISDAEGVLTRIYIESSTDKQRVSEKLSDKLESLGYGRGNEGLSAARNDAMYDYLTGLGVDGGLINQKIYHDQGKGKENAAEPQDPSARYVQVKFEVMFPSPEKSVDSPAPAKEYEKMMTFINSQSQDMGKTCRFPNTKPSKPHYDRCPIK